MSSFYDSTYESMIQSQTKEIESLKSEIKNIEENLSATIDVIPKEYLVRVCEGGGPENLLATLAVSIAKWKSADSSYQTQQKTTAMLIDSYKYEIMALKEKVKLLYA